jgi:transposase
MLSRKLTNFLSLPELEFTKESSQHKNTLRLHCKKTSKAEVCPKCATLSKTCYDKRKVSIKDSPIRGKAVYLKITKRRFYCKTCKKPFTEPVTGDC